MDTEGLTSIKLGARTWDCSTRFEISADLTRVLSVVLHPNCQKPRLVNCCEQQHSLAFASEAKLQALSPCSGVSFVSHVGIFPLCSAASCASLPHVIPNWMRVVSHFETT